MESTCHMAGAVRGRGVYEAGQRGVGGVVVKSTVTGLH